ncbi:kinase-like domain-containing protein [Clohesyomyces aquaticus]|uniref:Kinase-like domain-containing protein n=1 Tax=Clohesyomyces aquaticus TaxID=1231657 RepID=A0A1Y1ZQI8_9PLEO|nr:kinase-like domain-containing protein [Clohesyomyces aquaticus]
MSPPATPPPERDWWQFIEDRTVTYNFRGHDQEFLPKDALEEVTARQNIEEAVLRDANLRLNPQERNKLIDTISTKAPKLFATCLYCNFPMKFLKGLLDTGRTDGSLPLAKGDCPDPEYERGFKTTFWGNQKRFNAPFFPLDFHKSLAVGVPIPIQFDEEPENLKGKGAFGVVSKVRIHPSHHSFPKSEINEMASDRSNDETNDKEAKGDIFAMKVIQHQASAVREKEFVTAMSGVEKFDHYARCFASFTLGANYYMIYELADCNLQEFVLIYPDRKSHTFLTTCWLLKQTSGLASALRQIHLPVSSKPTNKLGVPGNEETTGYIHDIKPDNILCYIGKPNCFRLADYSCAKVAKYVASASGNNRRSHQTLSRSGTPNYRAPECHRGGSTSRPYDLWSLGCVFLELLVWFYEGTSAVDEFVEARSGSLYPGGIEDESFYFEDTKNVKRLRGAVVDKIRQLSDTCTGRLKFFLETITMLLKISTLDRLSAPALDDRLKSITYRSDEEVEKGGFPDLDRFLDSHRSDPVSSKHSESESIPQLVEPPSSDWEPAPHITVEPPSSGDESAPRIRVEPPSPDSTT